MTLMTKFLSLTRRILLSSALAATLLMALPGSSWAQAAAAGDAPADLASEGVPYTIDRSSFVGQLARDPAAADSVTGVWAHLPLGSGRLLQRRFPMNLDIFDFHG